MNPITIYENAGLFSGATSSGVLFYNLPRPQAEQRLRDSRFDPACLDTPVSGVEWRSTLTAAFASEIETLTEEIEGLAGASEDAVSALNSRLDKVNRNQRRLMRQLAATSDAVAVERQDRQERETEAEIDRRMRQYNSIAARGDKLPRWVFERQVRG